MTEPSQSALRQAAARLSHDVGKYVARTARNLPPPPAQSSPPPAALLDMLTSDLYGDAKQSPDDRPARRFARLSAGLSHARIDEVRAHFAALAAIETDVRAGQVVAVARAAALALRIDDSLRDLARLFARPVGK
jgi:hypothetical protein